MRTRILHLTVVSVVGLALAATALAQEEGKGECEKKQPAPKSMMERYDGKGEGGVVDGNITLEEYKAAMAEMAEKRFKALDKNEDGVLTEEELCKGRPYHSGHKAGKSEGTAE